MTHYFVHFGYVQRCGLLRACNPPKVRAMLSEHTSVPVGQTVKVIDRDCHDLSRDLLWWLISGYDVETKQTRV